jgi:hypothetical protein
MVRTKLWMKLLIMRCRLFSSSPPPWAAACTSLYGPTEARGC